jgi:hypothetical protein
MRGIEGTRETLTEKRSSYHSQTQSNNAGLIL